MKAWGQRVPVSLSQVRAWIVSQVSSLKYLLGQELGSVRAVSGTGCQETYDSDQVLEFVYVERQGTTVLVPSKYTDSYDDDDDDGDDEDEDNSCAHCSWGLSMDMQALWFLVAGG